MDYSALEDKSSPYYYGLDSTYKPRGRNKTKVQEQRPEFGLDFYGVPYRINQNSENKIDPKKNSGNGLNTSSGKITSAPMPQAENNPTTYGSFQEQQDALMASRSEGVNPLTAMLIRGIPKHPFSSTQLPTTSNNPYAALSEDSTYMKETVKQGLQNYGEFIAPDNLPLGTEEAFTSPVNYELGSPSEIDSMTAMRMKERDQGLMYASGQYFAAGKDGKPVLVNRDLAKAVKMGKEGARQELDAYLAGGGISPIGSDATPGFGVISNPSRDLMQPPTPIKTESDKTKPEFTNFFNTNEAGFDIQPMMSGLVETNYKISDNAMPDMTKKAGFFYEEAPIFQIHPEIDLHTNLNRQSIEMKY